MWNVERGMWNVGRWDGIFRTCYARRAKISEMNVVNALNGLKGGEGLGCKEMKK